MEFLQWQKKNTQSQNHKHNKTYFTHTIYTFYKRYDNFSELNVEKCKDYIKSRQMTFNSSNTNDPWNSYKDSDFGSVFKLFCFFLFFCFFLCTNLFYETIALFALFFFFFSVCMFCVCVCVCVCVFGLWVCGFCCMGNYVFYFWSQFFFVFFCFFYNCL